jgi:hypothetical protein
MKKLISILDYVFNDGLLMFMLGAALALAFYSYTTITTLQELDRLLVCK